LIRSVAVFARVVDPKRDLGQESSSAGLVSLSRMTISVSAYRSYSLCILSAGMVVSSKDYCSFPQFPPADEYGVFEHIHSEFGQITTNNWKDLRLSRSQ
jgi:hypothetical protein